jgi:hypothetical protein
MRPSKSVPGGCVIGLFGLMAWVYSAFCGLVIWRVAHPKVSNPELVKTLIWHAVIAFALGAVLFVIGWRLAMRVGDYDAWDQDEPRIKF